MQLARLQCHRLQQPMIKQRVIRDMTELISAHEWGHVMIQHHVLPISLGAFADAMQTFGCPALLTGLELLAELAPAINGQGGTLYGICQRSNREHANRQFWMFWSDTWFCDEPVSELHHYSECLSLIMLYALTPDHSLDIDAWADWIWTEKKGIFDPVRLWLIRWANQWMNAVLARSPELKKRLDSMVGPSDYAAHCQVWGQGLLGLDLSDLHDWNTTALAELKGLLYREIQKKWPLVCTREDVVACVCQLTNRWGFEIVDG